MTLFINYMFSISLQPRTGQLHDQSVNINRKRSFLTDDRVDILGRVFSKSTDTGALSRHGKAGQWPLAVHVLTNHRAHLPNTRESAGGRGKKTTKTLNSSLELKVKSEEKTEVGLTQSGGSVWCLWVRRCELCLCRWRHTGTTSHGWSWCWKK